MHLDEFLTIKGKNLFDKNNRTRIFGYFASTGTTWTYNASAYSNKIPCKPNTTYTARYNGNSTQAVLGFGSCSTDDEPNTSIGNVTVTQGIRQNSPTLNTPITITTGPNDKWLIVAYNVAEPQHTDMADNLQIEEGSAATSYESHKGEFKRIGDIWKRAVPKTTNKAGSIIFENTRKAVNLVDFNETRITSSTWATADKTKGFEIIADIYGKSVGGSLGGNGNCFGVFVPCKKGESVSIDFFDYTPYYGRCFYCEVDADFKVLTEPVQYSNGQSALTQKTFTATSNNCIGFAIEWFISSTQTRDYTKENYMVVKGTTVPTAYYPYFSPTKVLPSLKAYGGTPVKRKADKLWGRYVPVEYIESSGTQYIDTGIVPDADTEVKTKALCEKNSGFLFGSRTSAAASDRYAFVGATDSSKYRSDYYNSIVTFDSVSNQTSPFTVYKNKNVCSMTLYDGTTVTVTNTSGTFTSTFNVYIFACNTGGTASINSGAKVYSFQIVENGTLVRDFIPVKDVVNNVYGMYDRVNDKFYGNAGTGVFTAGSLIQPVTYIESNGQYINTRIPSNTVTSYEGYKLESTLQCLDVSTSSYIEGRYDNGTYYLYRAASSYFQAAYGSTYNNTSKSADTDKHTFVYTHLNDVTTVLCDDVEILTKENETAGGAIILCGTLQSNRLASRHWEKKIWYNDDLILDLIPIKLGTEYCMLDQVNWQIYHNEGTGSFTGGADIPYTQLCPDIIEVNTGDLSYGYSDGIVLPSEYERVSYTSMTNKGLVETNLPILKESDVIEIDFLFKSKSNQPVFGCNNSTQTFGLWIYNNKLTANSGGNGYAEIALTDEMINNPLHYKYEGTQLTITGNGVSITKTIGQLAPASDKTYKIFGSILPNSYTLSADVYRFTVNGRMDLIPVKKISNNEYGFFDLISKSFLGNTAGTGSLIGGSIIPRAFYADGEHKLTIGGKNLFDGASNLVLGKYIAAATGVIGDSATNYYCETYLEVKPNTSHVFFGKRKSDGYLSRYNRIHFYDATKTFISSSTYVEGQKSVAITPATAKYARLSCNVTDRGTLDIATINQFNWYFGEGIATTEYEPYAGPSISLDIPEILPSATSYFDQQTGTLYKDWGIKVLDGTENWSIQDNRNYSILKTALGTNSTVLPSGSTNIICSHYPVVIRAEASINTIYIGDSYVNVVGDSSSVDLNAWKSWLAAEYAAGHPVIVLYPLASPTTETKSTTPVSLTTKGSKTITSEAEIPTTVDATYLGM